MGFYASWGIQKSSVCAIKQNLIANYVVKEELRVGDGELSGNESKN